MHVLKSPSEVVLGGTLKEAVSGLCGNRKFECSLVITDEGVMKTGIPQMVQAYIQESDRQAELLVIKAGEPTVYDFLNLVTQVNEKAVGLLIAVGGGSVMDVTKLCSLLYHEEVNEANVQEKASRATKKIPSAMIPTTCGTGAEATCNAILAFPKQELKVGIVNPQMIPDEVILNAEVIRYLPAKILASTVVDALTHCIECYTSKKSNPLSDLYAEKGAELIFRYALRGYHNSEDMEAKEALMLAAYYGGLAITASGTTAVHALSYPLGGKYHIPHGIANAILFVPVMRYNKCCCEERLAKLNDLVALDEYSTSPQEKAEKLVERIDMLVKGLEIPSDLNAFGVSANDVEDLVERGMQVTRLLNNNLRIMTADAAAAIYRQILK